MEEMKVVPAAFMERDQLCNAVYAMMCGVLKEVIVKVGKDSGLPGDPPTALLDRLYKDAFGAVRQMEHQDMVDYCSHPDVFTKVYRTSVEPDIRTRCAKFLKD